MDVAGPRGVSTGHGFALLLKSKTQKNNRFGCFCRSFASRFEILWLTLCQLYNEFVIEVRLSRRRASLSVPLSSPPISASPRMLFLLSAVPSRLHPLRGGEKEPRALRHQRAACHGQVSSHFR